MSVCVCARVRTTARNPFLLAKMKKKDQTRKASPVDVTVLFFLDIVRRGSSLSC